MRKQTSTREAHSCNNDAWDLQLYKATTERLMALHTAKRSCLASQLQAYINMLPAWIEQTFT